MEEMMDKYQDFYAKHKIGSRFAMISFILLYIFTTVYSLIYGVKLKDEMFVKIMDITSWVAVVGFITTILGANGLDKLIDAYKEIKKK